MELNITTIIIIITVGVSLYTMNQPQVLYQLMMNPYMVVQRGQYYRLVTSGFIHKDFAHLAFNMISFYFFGTKLEYIFTYIFEDMAVVYFVALYVVAIVVSDLPTLFKNKNNPGYNSLGASGAVSAVIFACILFDPLSLIYIFFAIPIPGFILGVLYVVYSYVSAKRARDGINHDAHLYGALFGMLFCIVVYPAVIEIFIRQISEWNLFN